MKIDGKALGEKVKKRLKEKEMSQAQLAAECEISPDALWNYLSGKRDVPVGTLAAMAWVLGVTSDYLLGIEKRKKIIELPYRITPNSVLYWNEHTGMPGIATFQSKEDAETEYRLYLNRK